MGGRSRATLTCGSAIGAGASAVRSTRTVRCACSYAGSWRTCRAETASATRSSPRMHSSTIMSAMGADAFHVPPASDTRLRRGLASHSARVGEPSPATGPAWGPLGGASMPGQRDATIPDRHSRPSLDRGSTSALPNTHPLPAGRSEQAARTAAAKAAAEAASSRLSGGGPGGAPPGVDTSTRCRSCVARTSKPRLGPPCSQRSWAARSRADIAPSDRTENDGDPAVCRPTRSHVYTRMYGTVPHSYPSHQTRK